MSNISERVRSILIADSDDVFLETLKQDSKAKQYPLFSAKSGTEAQSIISNRDHALLGIFVSPSINHPHWLSVLRAAHLNRPATPLYMVLNDKASFKELTDIDLKKLGLKDTVVKPTSYSDLVKLVAPITLSFDAEKALEKAKQTQDLLGLDQEASFDDGHFIPIRSEDFLSGTKSFFDVYARLSSGRYVKLLQAGDLFTPDRIENYLKKGVTYFYIKKEIQELYVGYCEHLATSLLKHKEAPMDVKVAQTLNYGEQIIKHLEHNGVSDLDVRYAAKFSSNVRELLFQMDIKKNHILDSFINDITCYEHGVGTSMLSGILAHHLQIASENPLQIVGMASLLHDCALSQMPEILKMEDESVMSVDQLKLFKSHPLIGAKALSSISGFHPAAVQAIEQHHMRLKGRGFPERTATTPVTRLAEIVGICDEFSRIMLKCQKNTNLNMFLELELMVLPSFAIQVVQAFKKAFFPKHQQSD